MTFWKWSKTAATNATADSTINWAEGQAPSSVNDSARALMAAAAKFRDDVGGSTVTAGTSTAYTLTSLQVFTALQAGLFVAFNPHTTNGATPQINVDGLGLKPLRSAPNTEFPSGVLVQGTPYTASYFTSNSGEWIVNSITNNPYVVPIGGVIPYVGSTAPSSSFVLPAGQAISRTTYSVLFGLVSTTFGTGDGSSTFNVPDLRGRSIFGQDNMGGSAASRITFGGSGMDGTVLGVTGGAQNFTLTISQIPSHTHSFSGTTGGESVDHTHTTGIQTASFASGGFAGAQILGTGNSTSGRSLGHTHDFSGTSGSAGGGLSHTIMPPTMILPFILRII